MTAVMVTVPIGLFYLLHWYLMNEMGFDNDDAIRYGGLTSVFMVQVIAIGFGLWAYYDDDVPEEQEEEPSRKHQKQQRPQKKLKQKTK